MEIHTLDLGFQNKQHTIAAYLVIGPGGPVLVETGPGSTLKNLKARLAEYGYLPADIHHVLVTHIHLDHAGAAGWWAQQGAQVYVHTVGAPHLIDPTKLLASALRIYGNKMDSLWGETLPAPADQVTAVEDGQEISVNGLTFTALDTPGHAYHHHVFCLEDIAFTGDAVGIHIPGPDFVDLPAPPPEFHLERWLQTIDKLLEQSFGAIYPTHFGFVQDWHSHIEQFAALLKSAAEFVRARVEADMSRDEIVAQYMAWQTSRAREANMSTEVVERYDTANPQYMSVDGILRYWRKRLDKVD